MTFKFLDERITDKGITLIFKTDRGIFEGTAMVAEGEKNISRFTAYNIAELKARRAYYKNKKKEYNIQEKTYLYLLNAIESRADYYPDDVEYKTVLKNYYHLLVLKTRNNDMIKQLTDLIKDCASDDNNQSAKLKTIKDRLEEKKAIRRKEKEDFMKLLGIS